MTRRRDLLSILAVRTVGMRSILSAQKIQQSSAEVLGDIINLKFLASLQLAKTSMRAVAFRMFSL